MKPIKFDKRNPLAGFNNTTLIERTWEGLPGYLLLFPVAIALSGQMASEREATLGLTQSERSDALLDFRTRLLADVLNDAPKMVSIKRLTDAMNSKGEDEIKRLNESRLAATPPQAKLTKKDEDDVYRDTRLTDEELEALKENFPAFPEEAEGSLQERATAYFGATDGKGRKVFQLLVEDVIAAYWLWANPRPTFSVSAFLQNTVASSTVSSGS